MDDSMCVMLGWMMVGYLRTWSKSWLVNVITRVEGMYWRGAYSGA